MTWKTLVTWKKQSVRQWTAGKTNRRTTQPRINLHQLRLHLIATSCSFAYIWLLHQLRLHLIATSASLTFDFYISFAYIWLLHQLRLHLIATSASLTFDCYISFAYTGLIATSARLTFSTLPFARRKLVRRSAGGQTLCECSFWKDNEDSVMRIKSA